MGQITLSARIRDKKGKEVARELRRNREIPAIFYGPGTEPVMLTVRTSDLQGIMKKTAGENVILGLQIESDRGSDTKTVMLKELQMDPIKDHILHADFYEFSMDKELTVKIPIHLIGTPIGLEKGGILQQVRRDLTISCLPNNLMEHIDVDVSGLDIGDSIHVQDIEFPAEIKSMDDSHSTVIVMAAPTVDVEGVPEEAIEAEAVEEGGAETEDDGSGES
ncbi:MAG: 50S ribosomal protein L25/general stress protein Ctc [Pseudomonadota bacterium]